jgi:uncharacterized protein related to proFAR isomerase
MRTISTVTVALLVWLAASTSYADDVVGAYDVKYEEVANNCSNTGMSLTRGKVNIRKEKNLLVVDIERIPLMSGSPNKSGAVRATSKIGATVIGGVDGKFSVAGRVDDSGLQLVFVAEYYVKGSALCTQSWNLAGARAGTEAKAKAAIPELPFRF